jgi:hypothetical protein
MKVPSEVDGTLIRTVPPATDPQHLPGLLADQFAWDDDAALLCRISASATATILLEVGLAALLRTVTLARPTMFAT